MANTSAVILRNGEEALPVALCSDLAVIPFDTVGAGRLLHQAYTVVGGAVEKSLGRTAHKLGSGPTATSCRIEKALGDNPFRRQSTLDSIYDFFREGTTTQHLRALKKDCQKLLTYALPSRSPTTQIQTFRSIIRLTTRHPGLRRVFLQCPVILKAANSPDAICELWKSSEYNYDRESLFTLEFAAHCLARNDPSTELEDIRPSALGYTRETGLGILDALVVGYCDEGSGFPRLIAIRCLAGILELPAFWIEDYYKVHKLTMDKLCKQTLRLIEDINPDSVCADDIGRLALLDPDGVDALAEAVLVGGGKWIQRKPQIQGLDSDYWFSNFIKLIEMLRGLIISDFLPLASRRAAENWEDSLKHITDQSPMSSSDYQYEDVYVCANNPSRPNWRPSDIAEESLNVDDKRPSLLKAFTTTVRETLLRRTASKVKNTPPDSLIAEDSSREIRPLQETSEGERSTEEVDEAGPMSLQPTALEQTDIAIRDSLISDEITEPETPDKVDGMIAEEPIRPAEIGDTSYGTGEGNVASAGGVPVDVLDSSGTGTEPSDKGGLPYLFQNAHSVNIYGGNFVVNNEPSKSAEMIHHHHATIDDPSQHTTNYRGYTNSGQHIENYGSYTNPDGNRGINDQDGMLAEEHHPADVGNPDEGNLTPDTDAPVDLDVRGFPVIVLPDEKTGNQRPWKHSFRTIRTRG